MIKRVFKTIGFLLYAASSLAVTILVGCNSLTPTREPPLTKVLGYEVPEWKGWTLTGLNEAAYNIEVQKLDTWRVMIDVVNEPALEARKQVVNWAGMLAVGGGLGAVGGLPFALNRLPKGAVKREDYERDVEIARNTPIGS